MLFTFTVHATEVSNRNLLYFFAFLEGAAVMVVELSGARMLAPAYGASLPVWTIILSVAVGGLALGYYIGGRVAVRKEHTSLLLPLLACAALLVVMMPMVASMALKMFSSLDFWFSLMLSALLFFFPPVLLLGATTPVIARILGEERSAGKVFGISTLGGIAGTFIAGFYIIPSSGLTPTAVVTGIVLGAVPCLLLVAQKKMIIPLLLAAAVFLSLKKGSISSGQENVSILYRSEGLLGQLLVADVANASGGYDRVLLVNRMGQTWIDRETGQSKWAYVSMLPLFLENPHSSDVLLLGLGGGTVARELEEKRNARVDAVELDARIAEVAKKWFGLTPRTNIIIDDARHYIRVAKKKYDVVIFDVFKGEVPPAHALTLECFEEVKRLLKPGGKLIINFNGYFEGREGRAGRSIYRTLVASGYSADLVPTGDDEAMRNMLYTGQLANNSNNLPADLRALDKDYVDSVVTDINDAVVLRDDSPVLELINLPAAQRWREGYNSWMRSFALRDIPAFE